jgi:hypothetical protein
MSYGIYHRRLLHAGPPILCQPLTDIGNHDEPEFQWKPNRSKGYASQLERATGIILAADSLCLLRRKTAFAIECDVPDIASW